MPRKQTPSKTDLINEVLTRGVDTIYPTREALAKRLRSGKKLTLYLGVDPSGEDLHIGHTVVLHKLRQFQALGHKVILLIGDFTGQTGDPTDKQAVRKPLTKQQVLANARHYKKQASTVLDFAGANAAEIKYNSKWLNKLAFGKVAELAGHFTVQQMLERDMFEDRLKEGKPISLREFLYPLMQGYDSVAMEVDLEVGGTDQTFNMLAGRKLAKEYLGKDKLVLSVPLLADASGRKIGKTEGNAIAILSEPADLYGQVMALPDEVIGQAMELTTSTPMSEVKLVAKLAKTDPLNAKMRLAFAIVAEYHGSQAATRAQSEFIRVVQKGDIESARIRRWKPKRKSYSDPRVALVEAGLASSLSEAGRKFQENAVRLNGETFELVGEWEPVSSVLSVGKKPNNRVKVVR